MQWFTFNISERSHYLKPSPQCMFPLHAEEGNILWRWNGAESKLGFNLKSFKQLLKRDYWKKNWRRRKRKGTWTMIVFQSVTLSQNHLEHTLQLQANIQMKLNHPAEVTPSRRFSTDLANFTSCISHSQLLSDTGHEIIICRASTPVTSGGHFSVGRSMFFYFCPECWELLWQLCLHLLHSARGGHSVHVTHGRPFPLHGGVRSWQIQQKKLNKSKKDTSLSPAKSLPPHADLLRCLHGD